MDSVEFQNVVVHLHERIVHLLTMNVGRIAEHRHLCFWTVLVAQTDGVINDFCEVGMAGGLAVACKGQHVRQLPVLTHLGELCLQLFCHFLACWSWKGWSVVGIKATFAVDAVKRAYLAVGRLQVDA